MLKMPVDNYCNNKIKEKKKVSAYALHRSNKKKPQSLKLTTNPLILFAFFRQDHLCNYYIVVLRKILFVLICISFLRFVLIKFESIVVS